MIPGLLAQDIAQSLREFITTGFETDTWPFSGKFEALVSKSDDGDAFVKGPYVSIGLPFLKNTEHVFSGRGLGVSRAHQSRNGCLSSSRPTHAV